VLGAELEIASLKAMIKQCEARQTTRGARNCETRATMWQRNRVSRKCSLLEDAFFTLSRDGQFAAMVVTQVDGLLLARLRRLS